MYTRIAAVNSYSFQYQSKRESARGLVLFSPTTPHKPMYKCFAESSPQSWASTLGLFGIVRSTEKWLRTCMCITTANNAKLVLKIEQGRTLLGSLGSGPRSTLASTSSCENSTALYKQRYAQTPPLHFLWGNGD